MRVDNYMPECLLRRSLFFRSFPVKPVLKKIKMSYTRYFEEFTSVLYRHLETEYEVNIRNNEITDEGIITLRKLERDYDILQFEVNLR